MKNPLRWLFSAKSEPEQPQEYNSITFSMVGDQPSIMIHLMETGEEPLTQFARLLTGINKGHFAQSTSSILVDMAGEHPELVPNITFLLEKWAEFNQMTNAHSLNKQEYKTRPIIRPCEFRKRNSQ